MQAAVVLRHRVRGVGFPDDKLESKDLDNIGKAQPQCSEYPHLYLLTKYN